MILNAIEILIARYIVITHHDGKKKKRRLFRPPEFETDKRTYGRKRFDFVEQLHTARDDIVAEKIYREKERETGSIIADHDRASGVNELFLTTPPSLVV